MVMPYLRFHGDCEEAFRFYMECFDGRDLYLSRLNNDPTNPVMHASVMLTKSGGINGADSDEPKPTNFDMIVHLDSGERVETILAKLAVGGTIVSEFHPHPPPDDDGGGAHVIDKYGYSWFLCA